MAMVVENLLGIDFPPPEAAKLAMSCGARVSGGTDMGKLAEAACKAYPLTYGTTDSLPIVVTELLNGAMVIANVGGDTADRPGVFSDGGHYICLYRDVILDPGLYTGKYDKEGRRMVAVVDDKVFASIFTVHADTATRNPRYYIFQREG